MANIFSQSNDYVQSVNRNTFDLSFQNNFTTKFGQLTPVFCKPVNPGDSLDINSMFQLRFMPLNFPVQSPMKARLHFFYVRSRTLWSDFMDFYGRTKDNLVMPYINQESNNLAWNSIFKTGSLGDYLGLPTTYIGAYGPTETVLSYVGSTSGAQPSGFTISIDNYDGSKDVKLGMLNSASYASFFTTPYDEGYNTVGTSLLINNTSKFVFTDLQNTLRVRLDISALGQSTASSIAAIKSVFYLRFFTSDQSPISNVSMVPVSSVTVDSSNSSIVDVDFVVPSAAYNSPLIGLFVPLIPDNLLSDASTGPVFFSEVDGSYYFTFLSIKAVSRASGDAPLDLDFSDSPWYRVTGSSPRTDGIRINALPFRAYEAIYNAFYRDIRNNPFMIGGVPEYNKYIPSNAGGPDIQPYKLHFSNWEPDFLTTAVQSPQQGVAPLVGVTSTGVATFADESGNQYKAKLEVGSDGDTITGFSVQSPDMPQGSLRQLVNLATSGISISDFRNVNALQRWLETNMRLGLRFRDVIKGHFDVDVRYDDLQMPEFLGGVTDDVNVFQVTQTTPTFDSPLGMYAGQASTLSGMKNSVRRYFDEPGYVIGVFCVNPVPSYSQLLPKHFTWSNVLDYHFPEFNHIGFQPITYTEVAPIQAYNAAPADLNKVFGYQRAWYDLIASTDEVHGLFRTELRNFLVNRVFDKAPDLSEDFLLVDPKQVNDIFSVTAEGDDKILGSIVFNVRKKTSISRFGVPRLE